MFILEFYDILIIIRLLNGPLDNIGKFVRTLGLLLRWMLGSASQAICDKLR